MKDIFRTLLAPMQRLIDRKVGKDEIDKYIPEVEVPTKVSDLKNDAGYITEDDVPEGVPYPPGPNMYYGSDWNGNLTWCSSTPDTIIMDPLSVANAAEVGIANRTLIMGYAKTGRDAAWVGIFSNPSTTAKTVRSWIRFDYSDATNSVSITGGKPVLTLIYKDTNNKSRNVSFTVDDDGMQSVVFESDGARLNNVKEIVINSSTEGSTKKFKIAVDDSGTISATEVI